MSASAVLFPPPSSAVSLGPHPTVFYHSKIPPCGRSLSFLNPRAAPLLTTPPPAILCTALGAIQLGSKTAFTDLVGSFIILSTASYALAILPHVLTGRSHVPKGAFWMGGAGYLVNIVAVVLIMFFNTMFCFRTYLFRTFPISSLHANAFLLRSLRLPNHCLDDELQQCNPGWGCLSYDSMVVHARGVEVRGSEADPLL